MRSFSLQRLFMPREGIGDLPIGCSLHGGTKCLLLQPHLSILILQIFVIIFFIYIFNVLFYFSKALDFLGFFFICISIFNVFLEFIYFLGLFCFHIFGIILLSLRFFVGFLFSFKRERYIYIICIFFKHVTSL